MHNYLKILIIIPFLLAGCGNNSTDASFETDTTISNPANILPEVNDISSSTNKNVAVNFVLPTSDVNGDTLSYSIVSDASNGTTNITNNEIYYTPNTDFFGIDSFTYKANDGFGDSEVKTISIVVNDTNNAPLINDLSINGNKNIEIITSLPINDSDGDILTYSIVTPPNSGTVLIIGNTLSYTPDLDFFGTDSFTYKANDGALDSNIRTIDVSISNINNAPIIFTNNIPNGTEGKPYSYQLLAEDPDGDAITYNLEIVDGSGNVIAAPTWLTVDTLNSTISSTSIDLNTLDSINIRITATDIWGSQSVDTKVWNIVDFSPFITTWTTTNGGESDDNTIAFYLEANNDNYIDWGDGNIEINVPNGEQTHTYTTQGTYQIKIANPRAIDINGYHGGPVNKWKIVSLENWGSSRWDTFYSMFRGASNLISTATDTPDTNNVTDMSFMFNGASSFNSPIIDWDVSNVTNMNSIFYGALSFNQDISSWNVGNVTNMSHMFRSTSFNQDISTWDVSNVTNMYYMFTTSPFNQPLDTWDVSNVTNMTAMFYYSSFNQNINTWDVSNVTAITSMFSNSPFNQPLDAWNVSNITNLGSMFRDSPFDQDLSTWNVSNVTTTSWMFYNTLFNQPLDTWDVSNVTNMDSMFRASNFNQPLPTWNVSNVTNMNYMFYQNYDFNQDLSNWDVSNVTTMVGMLTSATNYSVANYDLLLNAWSLLTLQPNVSFGISQNYTIATSDAARTSIIGTFSWTIADLGGI